jgi:hypothetical protein
MLQQVADYQPGDRPKERNTHIHPFVSPAKGVKKSEAPHINKESLPLSVLMSFFTEIFHLLVEQTVYYQQHLGGQAGPSCRLPDITLPNMTFVALALQMGHKLKTHYMTTGRDPDSYTICFIWQGHDMR